MKYKEFENGNVNLKIDDMKELEDSRESSLVLLLWELMEHDFEIVSEEYCLSNYDIGVSLYNLRNQKEYTLSYNDVYNKLEKGHTMKLYAYDPNQYDIELMNIIK